MKQFNFQSRFLILLLGFLILGISQAWGEATLTGKTVYKCRPVSVATASTYTNYAGTLNSINGTDLVSSAAWQVNCCSNNGNFGANSNSKTKMKLSQGSYSWASAIATAIGLQTSSTYVAAAVCTTEFSNVGKFSFSGCNASYTYWLCYSTDNWETVTAVALTSGTSGNYTFSSTVAKARYAFVAYNSSGQFQIQPLLTFYEGTSAPSYTITPQSNNDLWGTVELEGSTITATPKSGYRISATNPYEVTSGTAEVEQNGNTFTVTPSEDCTVQINFEAIPKHTVTWSVNKQTTTEQVAEGAAITLPANPDAPDGCYEKAFYGWTTNSTVDPSTAPEIISSPVMGNSDVTYYAVFAESSGISSKEQSINLSAFDEKGTSGGDGGGFTEIVDGFTFTTTSAYKSSSNQYLQIYKSSTLTISSDKTITKINFSGNNSSYPPSSFVLTSGGGEYSSSNSSGVYYGEWSGSAKSITFTASSSQVRIYTLKITYNDVSYSDFTTYCETPTKCEDPIISLAEGTYTEAQTVTLTRKTKDAIIYYTIDGTNPATSGTKQTYSSPITVNQDMTLKAVAVKEGLDNSEVVSATYTINYTVTFNANGHGTAPDALTPVKYNTTISAPTEPSETGWNFGGWYKEQACTNAWNFASDQVTDNMTLYAQWSRKQTTITLSQEDATTKGTEQIVATWGLATPSVTIPVRTGHDFKGYFDAETEGTRYLNSNGNSVSGQNWDKEDLTATLYARWEAQEYTINYRDQNSSTKFSGTWPTPDTHPTKHTYGIETPLVNPSRTGYTFDGWFGNSECKGVAITAIAGDAYTASFNIYAKWTAKNYEVTFNKNSEEAGGSMDPQPFAFDEQKALTENEFTAPAHKHFAGWAKTFDGTVAYADGANYKLTSENAELFAVWAYNQTTITLDKQGGTGGNTSVTATYGSAMPSAGTVPNKTGYDFNGYYTGQNGQGKKYYNADNTSATTWDKDDATLTLYAYWTPKTITITLNKGSLGQADGTATFVFNTKTYASFTPVEPTTGYTLDGYYTTANGGSLVIKNDGTLGNALYNWIDADGNWIKSSNDNLYAHYSPINYSVTWLVNGTEWTGKGGSTEAAYNSKITNVPTTLPTTSECDDEKVFMGWTANEIDGTTDTRPADLFTKAADAPTITGETKYYAVFAKAEGTPSPDPVVTLDFTDEGWNFPSTAKKNESGTYTNGDYSITISASSDGHKKGTKTISGGISQQISVLFGKNNTTLTLPNFGFPVSKIETRGVSGGSTNVIFNIYSEDNAASTQVTDCTTDHTFEIADTYQSSELAIKVCSDHNLQIGSLKVYAGVTFSAYATECEAEQPVITTQPIGGQYIEGNPIAPLSVVATPANKVTYQWQKSNNSTDGFTNIDGATNSSYTPDNTILGTTYYRCVVTNRDKSATSNPASIQITAQTTCATPSFAITGGGSAFIRETKVTMTTTTDGADIYYTLDGSTPSTTSEKYTEPVKITATTTVNAIAAKVNMTNSSMGSATFTKATLQSIAVKTAPKTEYTALETFDPTDLVITATYNYDLSEEVDYANHSSEFTFNPSTSTPLNVTDNTISITWEQKSTTQAITVNPIAMTAPEPTQTACNFTSVTIAWAAVANADHYEIAWNGGDYVTATSPYVKTDLTYSSNYTYKVKVVGLTNYGTAETEALNASTKTREVASIKDVVAPTKTYYVGDQVKNTDITCTVVYNNEDEEQGNPQFVGFASNPTSATTAALTDAQVGTTTIYVKSVNTELTTTITVEETPKHMFVDRVNGNTAIVKEGQGTIYDVPTLTGVVSACTYAPNNNIFKGWVDADFTGDVITDDDLLQETSLTISGGKTFYAVWAEHKVEDVDGIASSTNLSTANAILETGKPINYTSSASFFNPLRIYQNTTITISATTGTYITSVKFDCASGYDATDFTATPTSQSTEGTIYDWAGNANSIAFKATSQVRLEGITVKYYQTVEKDVNYISDCVAMYELSFDANGGTGTAPEAILLKEGGKVNLPNATLTKAYNDFYGWNTAADGKGTHYDVADKYTMGAEEAVLYADWAPRAVESLEITTPATTLEFGIGQTFSSEGLKVKANYIGGETEADVAFTTNYDNHIFTADEEGQPIVTISYKGATTTYNILVAPALIVRFFVNGTQIQEKSVFDKKIGAMPNAMTSGAWTDPENAFIASHYPIFAGWTLATSDDAIEFINEGTGITTNVDVNAVFAKSATPDLDNKTLATSIDPSKRYVIVDGENYYSGEASDNDWGVVDAEYAEIITFYGKSGVYAIQQADGNYINTPKYNTSSDHKFYLSEEPVHSFNMVMVTKDNVDYYGLQATNTEEYLRNNSSNTNCLRWYNNGTPAQLYSVDVTYDHLTIAPNGDHVRTGLTYDQAGTICLPYAVKADDYKGASVWSIENKTGTNTMITSITLAEEVEDDGITKKDLEAGKPYIFFAEESEFQLFYSGDEYTDNESVWANGLIGNLDVNPIIINPTEYIPGTYLINQNKLMECGTNCNVPQYRAYVKAYDIQYVVQAPPAAPRRVIGNPSGTPTNLNGLNSNGKAQKALIDGHIYILRDNKMYNAQGLFVK